MVNARSIKGTKRVLDMRRQRTGQVWTEFSSGPFDELHSITEFLHVVMSDAFIPRNNVSNRKAAEELRNVVPQQRMIGSAIIGITFGKEGLAAVVLILWKREALAQICGVCTAREQLISELFARYSENVRVCAGANPVLQF